MFLISLHIELSTCDIPLNRSRLLNAKKLKNDCKYLTETINITSVELFKNFLLKHIPCDTISNSTTWWWELTLYLTALDTDFNCERLQDTVQTGVNAGKYKYNIAWRKPRKKLYRDNIIYKRKSWWVAYIYIKEV